MKTYFAYVRVSTSKQAFGVSPAEQRPAIEWYAANRKLPIIHWFEEIQTATKSGRPTFEVMLRQLSERRDMGLILHKIDRGARNLKDWAALGELIDRGVDVRFAHDDLDLETRGGRLTADIQAVIAADYIRNLREEVRKGMYGRLRQGLYPLSAPVGYRNRGGGRVKTPDPITAPLVIHAFRAYATGEYTLTALSRELHTLGLSGRTDRPLSPTTISNLLRRPFYVGTCRMRGEEQQGAHQPLVSQELFQSVQKLLRKRRSGRRSRHAFRYALRLQCQRCSHSLTGERQKAHVYYRCHHCPGVSVREDTIDRERGQSDNGRIPLPKGDVVVRTMPPSARLESEKFDSPRGFSDRPKFEIGKSEVQPS